MSLSLILLLFLSNMHTLLCFPVGTTTNEDIMTESPNEFMKILYKCWSLKDDDDYKKCLEAMGEGDRVGEIMNANEVTGLIGNCKLKTCFITVNLLVSIVGYMHIY